MKKSVKKEVKKIIEYCQDSIGVSEETFRKEVDWDCLNTCKDINFSEDFIREFKNELDLELISDCVYQNISDSFKREIESGDIFLEVDPIQLVPISSRFEILDL